MTTQETENLVQIGQLSRKLGVAIETLRRWDKSGLVKAIRLGPKKIRYYKLSEVEALMDNKKGS